MIRYNKLILFLLLVPFFFSNCNRNSSHKIVNLIDNTLFVDSVLNLNGDTLSILENTSLVFSINGKIVNGVIKGNKTQIKGNRIGIFEDVDIMGSWSVPIISSEMFIDIHRTDCLKELFELLSSDIHNTIIVESGEYCVSIDREWGTALNVLTNTEVIINGVISLTPNHYKGYQIINVLGNDIFIHGRGSIIGDKHSHLSKEGEWGMGINISNGNNIKVYDLEIKECWGDCIYVGNNPYNVQINNCQLDHGRRQGISITSGDSIVIENCFITNVKGTAPEYAVDVEPNKNETVGTVFLKNVKVRDCTGGFTSWCGARNSRIGHIEIENCIVEGNLGKSAYGWYKNTSVNMQNCLEHGNIVQK